MRLFLPVLVMLFGLTIGSTNYAFAELDANSAYVLEGSGFAVTESTIKTSQIDFALTTGSIDNGRGGISIEEGFVTLDNDDFVVNSVSGTILRDGKFLRISGTAEDSTGDEIKVRIFGRLIEDSTQGSVYSFTGRITLDDDSYKILYTTKVSGIGILSTPIQTLSSSDDKNTIRIMPGSSSQSTAGSYISGYGGAPQRLNYFSQDRITVEPGNSITIVNDDDIAHTIVSGAGLGTNSRASQGEFILCAEDENNLPEGFSYAQSNCSFTLDGRINTGEILPGESITVTFEESGFYRLIDPDYPWMNIVVYSFHNVDSLIIGTPGESYN
jgi:plastocyanin